MGVWLGRDDPMPESLNRCHRPDADLAVSYPRGPLAEVFSRQTRRGRDGQRPLAGVLVLVGLRIGLKRPRVHDAPTDDDGFAR